VFNVPRASRPVDAVIVEAQSLSTEVAAPISSVKDPLPGQWIKRHISSLHYEGALNYL
jgi:hypothetical protein